MPEIKIVRHVRARKLRLRVEPASIRLTVPLFCSKTNSAFLAQSEQWLTETWNKQQNVNRRPLIFLLKFISLIKNNHFK